MIDNRARRQGGQGVGPAWVPRRRRALLMAGIGGAALCGSLVLSALPAGAASSHHRADRVKAVHHGSLGTILVTSSGQTLYHLKTEDGGHIKCTGSCATLWPPLQVKKGTKLEGVADVRHHLGTITRPDGSIQVTYDHWPLYRYSGDTKAGQTKGQGFEGLWYVVNPAKPTAKVAGAKAKHHKHAKAAEAKHHKSTTTTNGSSGGYGY